MTNKELSIVMRLKDEASKRLTGLQGTLQKFKNAWSQSWLGITASITAGVLAVKKAFDLAKLGAEAQQVEQSFANLAGALGHDAQKMRQDLAAVSAETVNFSNVAAKLNSLMVQGLGSDQIVKLMEVARAEARKTGKTVEDTFNQIGAAVAGGRLASLKTTFGLNVDLKRAVEDYAEATGMSTEAVEKNYKAQAIANEIMRAAQLDLAAFNSEQKTEFEHLQSISSLINDVTERVGQSVIQAVREVDKFISAMIAGFFDLRANLNDFFLWLFDNIARALEFAAKIPGLGKHLADAAANLRGLTAGMETQSDVFRAAAQNAREMIAQVDAIINQTGELTAAQKTALQSMAANMREAAAASAQDSKKSFEAMEEFGKAAAQNIQSVFADFMYNSISGKFQDLQDVAKNFGDTMLRILSQVIAKIILIKALDFAIPGLGTSLGALFHQGGMIQKAHNGMFIKAHNGLAPDEVPIIAQTGEAVLNRRAVRNIGGSAGVHALNRGDQSSGGNQTTNNIVIHAIDTQSFQQALRSQANIFVESVIDAVNRNGKVRSVLRRA